MKRTVGAVVWAAPVVGLVAVAVVAVVAGAAAAQGSSTLAVTRSVARALDADSGSGPTSEAGALDADSESGATFDGGSPDGDEGSGDASDAEASGPDAQDGETANADAAGADAESGLGEVEWPTTADQCRKSTTALQQTFCQANCYVAGTRCYTPDGTRLLGALEFSEAQPGETIVIHFIGYEKDRAGRRFEIAVDGDSTLSVLAHPADGADAGANTTGLEGGADAAPVAKPKPSFDASQSSERPFVVASRDVLVPDSASASTPILVRVKVTDANDSMRVFFDYSIPIKVKEADHFLEVGLLVPFVLGGDRTIAASPVPNTHLQTLEINEDLHVTFGIALNIYPFSVPATSGASFPLKRWRFWESYRYLGIQAGTTLDFSSSSFREWYVGPAIRLLSGVSISAGVAMVRGQFLSDNFREGMLVPTDGSIAHDTKYMFRPYFGLTLSTDVLSTVANVFTSINRASSALPGRPTQGN